MMAADQRLEVRIRKQDRERLETIRATLGLSMSGTMRVALAALSRQMGFDKEFSDGFLQGRE